MDHGMADLGSRLQRAREQRGLTLRDIANTTKISMTALKAIEHNDFARLPGGVFRKAYIRAFAAEVGLNADEVAHEYRSRFEPEMVADPLLVRGEGCNDRGRRLRAVTALAVAGGGLLVCGFLLWQPQIPPSPPDQEWMFRDVVANPPDGTAAIDKSDGSEEAAFATAAVAEVDPTLRLEIRFTGLCWVSAVADSERVLYRLMHPGERTLVEARSAITLRVGDAGAVAYSINGATGRPLGKTGEAVTVHISNDNLGRWQAEPARRLPNEASDAHYSPRSVRSGQEGHRRRKFAA